jgi:hypothetical protein
MENMEDTEDMEMGIMAASIVGAGGTAGGSEQKHIWNDSRLLKGSRRELWREGK